MTWLLVLDIRLVVAPNIGGWGRAGRSWLYHSSEAMPSSDAPVCLGSPRQRRDIVLLPNQPRVAALPQPPFILALVNSRCAGAVILQVLGPTLLLQQFDDLPDGLFVVLVGDECGVGRVNDDAVFQAE